jgi:hypothetical protein
MRRCHVRGGGRREGRRRGRGGGAGGPRCWEAAVRAWREEAPAEEAMRGRGGTGAHGADPCGGVEERGARRGRAQREVAAACRGGGAAARGGRRRQRGGGPNFGSLTACLAIS